MRKKFTLLTLAVVVAIVGLTATSALSGGICGDSNADGAVNISDAVYLIAYIFSGGQAPTCLPCPQTDVDGNVFQVVTIGTQVWMSENLKVTHYRNGDPIPNVTDAATWANFGAGAFCNYDNDANTVSVYGRLYNWHAVSDSRGLAPAGWHVASEAEWQTLIDYLGGAAVAGGKLKEFGTAHWSAPNLGATNESRFTALPTGIRYIGGTFYGVGTEDGFWSSTEISSGSIDAWYYGLGHNDGAIWRHNHHKQIGFSVRCVKD
jgi:uncharacterized protein (TIGR02145 family)